eukprot:UN10186
MIVTDKFMTSSGKSEVVLNALEKGDMKYDAFDNTVPDPTTNVVDNGVDLYKTGNHDGLIALGGGSPMDTAKAIGILTTNKGKMRDFKAPNVIPNPGPPLIAIPTTAGTGSEVTKVTVITDTENDDR